MILFYIGIKDKNISYIISMYEITMNVYQVDLGDTITYTNYQILLDFQPKFIYIRKFGIKLVPIWIFYCCGVLFYGSQIRYVLFMALKFATHFPTSTICVC